MVEQSEIDPDSAPDDSVPDVHQLLIKTVMANSLDIVPVGIEDVRAVVVLVVLGAKARFAVVDAAGGEGGAVEVVDLLAVLGAKGDVDPWLGGRADADVEIGFERVRPAEGKATAEFDGSVRELLVAERSESLVVEVAALREITDVNGEVVDHRLCFL
jgi:hypothetical protein